MKYYMSCSEFRYRTAAETAFIYSRRKPVPDIGFPATKAWSVDSDGDCLVASIFSPSHKLLHDIPILEYLKYGNDSKQGRDTIQSSREIGKNVTMSMDFILKVGRNGVLVHLS